MRVCCLRTFCLVQMRGRLFELLVVRITSIVFDVSYHTYLVCPTERGSFTWSHQIIALVTGLTDSN